MRNLDDNQFDEVFRQNLEPDYNKFDEGAWEEMEQKLNGIGPKTVSTIPFASIVQYSAVALMLSISGAGLWQANQHQKAINQLSTELNELKQVKPVATVEPVTTHAVETPNVDVIDEIPQQEMPKVKATIEVATDESPKLQPQQAENKKGTEQNDDSEPLVAKAAKSIEHPGAAEGKLKTTVAKYYILVGGEFIPVAEMDHPGAAEKKDTASASDLSEKSGE